MKSGTADGETSGDTNRSRTYIGVVVVEALVIAALWAFSSYFGS